MPGEPGLGERGLYYERAAAAEGGPRNGVLTAVEDFLAERPELRLAIVAPFFGLGVVWHPGAAWAAEVEAAVAPWDRNPVLERVEAKRVDHLVAEFAGLQRIDAMRSEDYELQFLLTNMLQSKAFALAERVSRLRQGGQPDVLPRAGRACPGAGAGRQRPDRALSNGSERGRPPQAPAAAPATDVSGS